MSDNKILLAKEHYLNSALSNYPFWAMRIMVFLARNTLWNYYGTDSEGKVTMSTTEPTAAFSTSQAMLASGVPVNSMKSYDILLSTVDVELLNELTLTNQVSASAVWEYLESRHSKQDLSAKANAIFELTNFSYSAPSMRENKNTLLEIQLSLDHAFKNKPIAVSELVTLFALVLLPESHSSLKTVLAEKESSKSPTLDELFISLEREEKSASQANRAVIALNWILPESHSSLKTVLAEKESTKSPTLDELFISLEREEKSASKANRASSIANQCNNRSQPSLETCPHGRPTNLTCWHCEPCAKCLKLGVNAHHKIDDFRCKAKERKANLAKNGQQSTSNNDTSPANVLPLSMTKLAKSPALNVTFNVDSGTREDCIGINPDQRKCLRYFYKTFEEKFILLF